MGQYLLSTYAVENEVREAPRTPEEVQAFVQRVAALEAEMEASVRSCSVAPPVLLREQDRTTWDRAMIEEGHAIVRACVRRGQPGPFQLQAAIQAVHCAAGSFEATDWPQIVALYDHLFSVMPTPVVALNWAIAVAEVEGPGAALTTLDAVAPDLDTYHLLHAARGTMLRRLGRRDAARAAFERAAQLAATGTDRRFLAQQVEELAKDAALTQRPPSGSTGPTNDRAR